MQKVKRRIFSGVVCEQEVFNISARIKEIKHAAPRMRFRDEEERAKHREGISRRKHARLINENFAPPPCTVRLRWTMRTRCTPFRKQKRFGTVTSAG